MLNLSKQERDELGLRLCREIDAWEIRRNALMARWDRHEQLYACDEAATTLNSVEGIGTYPVSLWRSKCDTAKGDLVGGILSAYPIVQCIQEGPEGTNETVLEQALMQLADRSRFPRVFPLAVHTAFNTNAGILRVRPTVDSRGNVSGVDCDWFHPKHVCFYPAAVERVEQCKTVGHRFFQGLWEIEAKQKAGEYFKHDEPIIGNDDPDRDDQLPGRFDRVTSAGSDTIDLDDSFVECWEVVTRHRIRGQWTPILVTLARTSQKVLRVQEYPYSRPWYEIVRPLQTEKRVLTNDSVAQGVQGYCLAAQDLMNAIVGGAYMTAYPVVWMKGYLGPNQAKVYQPGEVFPLGPDGQMGVLGLPFDANKFAAALEKFEQYVDSTVGISRIGSNQNLPASTKATAINGLLAADERRQASYLDAAADAVEGVFSLLFEYLAMHREELGRALGGSVAAVPAEAFRKAYRLEVTGRSGASNPNTLLQKLQFVMQLTQDPRTTLDFAKVQQRVLDTLDLPFDTSGLQSDQFTQFRTMFDQMTQQGVDPMQALATGLQAMEANGQFGAPTGDVPQPGMGDGAGVSAGAAGADGGGINAMLAGALAGAAGGDFGSGPVPAPGAGESVGVRGGGPGLGL